MYILILTSILYNYSSNKLLHYFNIFFLKLTYYHPRNGKTTCSRPNRCCIYCHAVISGRKLKRHIFRQHKSETDVKAAMLKTRQLQVHYILH